jgi:hypothetical protein
MEYDGAMRNRTFAVIFTAVVVAGGLSAWAQQKPISSRTSIVVYKSPT